MNMKKSVLAIIFLFSVILSSSAQDLIYRPYRSGGSSSTQGQTTYPPTTSQRRQQYYSEPQSNIVRANAIYTIDGNNYYKVPIQVDMSSGTNHYGGTSYYVVAEYRSTGYSGQWQNLSIKAYVQTCNSLNAYGTTARLEKSYMYKAQVNGKWYFFDL